MQKLLQNVVLSELGHDVPQGGVVSHKGEWCHTRGCGVTQVYVMSHKGV